VQRLEELGHDLQVLRDPALGGRVGEVEVQPDELARRRRLLVPLYESDVTLS
jgi:hypothetical protein